MVHSANRMRLCARAKATRERLISAPVGVAIGVQDSRQRNGLLRGGAQQHSGLAVEGRAPLHQLFYAERTLAHERLGCRTVNDSIAGIDGVFKMQGEVCFAFRGNGDSTLGIMRVRFPE